MTNELAIRILTGDILGTPEQTREAVTVAVKALSLPDVPDTNVGDTISRQAAIDMICKACQYDKDDYTDCNDREPSSTFCDYMNALRSVPSAQLEPSEITDEQAILHLHSTGWLQNHDREMYEGELRKQLEYNSEGYDSLISCKDTISRQVAIDAIQGIGRLATLPDNDAVIRMSAVEYVLFNLPSAQSERKRGKWIEHHEPYTWMGYTYWTCSECGFGEDDNKVRSNYCPNCGADMRGEQDE